MHRKHPGNSAGDRKMGLKTRDLKRKGFFVTNHGISRPVTAAEGGYRTQKHIIAAIIYYPRLNITYHP